MTKLRRLTELTSEGHHSALAALLSRIPGLSPQTPILDIGCGTGAWLERLADLGYTDTVGIDRDLSQKGPTRAPCFRVDIDWDESLGLGDRKFGLITAIEVIEHLLHPGKFFFHACRHLDANGHILITTPNIHSLICRIRFLLLGKMKQFDDKGDINHLFPILLPSLLKILDRHNLSISAIWPYPIDGGSITTIRSLRILAWCLRAIISDPLPGDHLCILIKRVHKE